MPNQKLLEEKIDKLHDAVIETFYDYGKEKNSDGSDWRELQDKFKASFRTLMAAIALANDPAYNIPEGTDLDAEIEKRRKVLEADETFVQATYGSEDDIVSVPKEKWEYEDEPETLPLEDIIKNFDAKMKAKQPELDQVRQEYGIGTSKTGPNLPLFRKRIDAQGNKLNRQITKLLGGEKLSADEMQTAGNEFISWMGYVEAANDPQYASLKKLPEGEQLDGLLRRTEIYKFTKSPVFNELFKPGREQDVLEMICGPREQWKDGKPARLSYDEMKKNLDERVKAIEAQQKQAEEKQHAEQHAEQEVRQNVEQRAEQNVEQNVEQAPEQNIVQNADKWIEEFRKGGFEKMEDGKKVIDTDKFANIMAARMLVSSVRGNQKSLQKSISMEDIAQKADELKDDPTYQNFLWKLESDPKAMQQALSAAKSGHGGGLDDMFKKHVKELPPGELSNSPVLARYMPTAKERIEFLQAHAEQHPGNPTETIAEIIALRNLVHAERGKASSLNTPIPTDPERSLQAKEKPLHQSIPRLGMRLMNSGTDIIKLIARGHGGEMLEAFRAGAQKLRAEAQMLRLDPETLDGFHENTIGSRLKQLRGEAKNLGKNPSAEQVQTLLGEYLILDRMTRDPKTGQIDEDKLNMDTPWSKVAKNTERYVKDPEFKRIMGTMKDDQLLTVAEGMATKPQESFVNSIWGKMVDIHKTLESATAKKAPQAPQPSVEVEKQRKPEAPEMGKP